MAYTNIDDPSAYFQTLLWTGNSTDARALTNDGNSDLQPDWVWLKNRDLGYNHFLQDSSRGNTKVLSSDSNATESTFTDMVESFDTNGFTVGFDGSQVPNFNGNTFVGWQWKANGSTTSSNTDGDITSTVQVNQDAGFSIVTDSPPNNTARSIGHGLGVAPKVVIRRARNRVENWRVFHSAAGSTGALTLDGSAAYNSSTVLFTGVTSSTFGVGTDFSVNGNYNYISYCFAEKQGYSKFGSYVGNSNTNGAFIYTGFKPAFLLIKESSNSGNGWFLLDSTREPSNTSNSAYLRADETGAEGTSKILDLLSNGFKLRNNDNAVNGTGRTYIYMAFAENPFTTSTGVPCTAR